MHRFHLHRKKSGGLAAAALWLAFQAGAQACATCMGGDDQQLVEASNTVLWSLLSLVGFIFVATGCTVWYLWRKAAAFHSPEIRLIDCLSPQPAKND